MLKYNQKEMLYLFGSCISDKDIPASVSVEVSELVPCFALLEITSGRLPAGLPLTYNTPPDPLPEFFFGSDASNLYQYFRAGSLYVHTEFTTTCPTATHVHSLAPADEDVPTGQLVQIVAPVALEYVPETQFVHTVAPATANFPTAHAVHTAFTLT